MEIIVCLCDTKKIIFDENIESTKNYIQNKVT